MNANVAIQPLIKSSDWWSTAALSLYEGEIAWEIAAGTIYMLRGDGQPLGGSGAGGYTRLRVSADSFVFVYNEEEKRIDDILELLRQEITTGVEYDQDTNTLTLIKTGALDLPLELPAADTEKDGLMTSVFVNKLNENTDKISVEKGRAEEAEDAIAENLALEIIRATERENELQEAIEAQSEELGTEITRAQEAEDNIKSTPTILDEGLGVLNEVTEDNPLTQKSYTDQAIAFAIESAREEAAGENAGRYASLINPQFIDDPEEQDPYNADHVITVPDLRLTEDGEILQGNQPVPAKNWKELYDITLETSGALLRKADKDEGDFEELLIADVPEGSNLEYYREVDHREINPNEFITIGHYNELYDLILDTAGESLRAGDSDIRELRLVDAPVGVPQTYRELDRTEGGGFSDEAMFTYNFSWVD